MRVVKNVIKSVIWYATALPMALSAGILTWLGVLTEALLRWGDLAWNPFNPFKDVELLKPESSSVPRPAPVSDDDYAKWVERIERGDR